MKRVLQIEHLRKRVIVSGLLQIAGEIHEQEVWLSFEEGVRLRGRLSIALKNPSGSSQMVFLDCHSGSFDLDERLQSHIGEGKPSVKIHPISGSGGGQAGHSNLTPLSVEAEVSLFGIFSEERQAGAQSVSLVIGDVTLGPFAAYEADVRGGSRRMSIEGVSVAILQDVSAALTAGKGCELISV